MKVHRTIPVSLAVVLSAAALAGSAAAVPVDVISGGSTSSADTQPTVQRAVAVEAESSGFDWGSAAIGAAGGVGVFAIALAGGARVPRVVRVRGVPLQRLGRRS